MIFLVQFVLIWLTAVIFTFLHELAHAIPVLIAGHKTNIILGKRGKSFSFTIGSLLTITVAPASAINGYYQFYGQTLDRTRLISYTAGPLSNFLFLIIFIYFSLNVATSTFAINIYFAAFWNLLQFLLTAIPIQYPDSYKPYAGMQSDGLRILNLLRKIRSS